VIPVGEIDDTPPFRHYPPDCSRNPVRLVGTGFLCSDPDASRASRFRGLIPSLEAKYSVRDGRFIFERAASPECNGQILIRTPAIVDSTEFALQGDTLRAFTRTRWIHGYSGNTIVDSSQWRSREMLDRQEEGDGLTGLWRFVGREETLIQGTPDSQTLIDVEGWRAGEKARREEFRLFAHFDGSVMTYYVDDGLSAAFIRNWNVSPWGGVPDKDRYDISVRAMDRRTVEFKGRKTGETVRYRVFDYETARYSSDNPAHLPHTYYAKPVICPNPEQPFWFHDFKEANAWPRESTAP
jgi:hypothetical protein